MGTLTLAVDANGRTRFVGEVKNGIASGCFCSVCGSPLAAKQGPKNTWHFAHEAGQERPDCEVGALNLFRRLVVDTLQAAMPALPRDRGIAPDIEKVDWHGDVAKDDPAATVELKGGRRVPLFIHVSSSRSRFEPAQHGLVFRCGVPDREAFGDRDRTMAHIRSAGALAWCDSITARPRPDRRSTGFRSDTRSARAFDPTHRTGTPIKVCLLPDRTVWLLYFAEGGRFLIRQWPEPLPGWDARFDAGVAAPRRGLDVYEVADYVAA